MRYLVLADIHANFQALTSVLADASSLGYDDVLVLGDLVGYGGDPAAVIERVFSLSPRAMVRGNHDKLCAGLDQPSQFNADARAAIAWTARVLTEGDLQRLSALPAGPLQIEDGLVICHGAPSDEDRYLLTPEDAWDAMSDMEPGVCLFGHTHCPAVFGPVTLVRSGPSAIELALPRERPVLVNVGAVGQPRDGDLRAAYGILDTGADRVLLRRVPYDVAGAQARILQAGLPVMLAERLAHGQ